jgi:hypothetical protein
MVSEESYFEVYWFLIVGVDMIDPRRDAVYTPDVLSRHVSRIFMSNPMPKYHLILRPTNVIPCFHLTTYADLVLANASRRCAHLHWMLGVKETRMGEAMVEWRGQESNADGLGA